MINLLKFNGKLISNGLAAMSPDCKYSKLPGNMLFLLSIRTKHRGRKKETEGQARIKTSVRTEK